MRLDDVKTMEVIKRMKENVFSVPSLRRSESCAARLRLVNHQRLDKIPKIFSDRERTFAHEKEKLFNESFGIKKQTND